MKTNWQTKKLGEVCDFVRGPFGGSLTKSIFKKDGYAVYEQQHAIYNQFDNSRYFIDEKKFKEMERFELKSGDLIMSCSGTMGKIAIAPKNIKKGIINQALLKLTPSKQISNEFLKLWMQSKGFQDSLKKISKGVAIKNVASVKILKQIKIPLPSLSEQHRIVKILDEVFEKIEKAKENAGKNLQNTKELFESYLQSVFANPGKDWEEKSLGDVCDLYQGIAINAKTKHALVKKSNLPLLRIKDLKNNTEEQYIDPNNYPKNALVNESDIIYTRTGSLGLVFRGRKGILHNNSFKIVPKSVLTKDYLFIWLQNPIFKSKILDLAGRVAQPDITHAIFKIQKIDIPSIPEQKSIVAKLDALSAETKKLEAIYKQKIADLEELKKSVLKKAFNGEL
ncbi:hypothetical protein A2X44_03835 [candidate division CPR3 bacterium GWF2_35_18]|uniref:Type I restriction modification DNA specificity domain-containing protein n=1 Tax=candidate division CPR3 bacterium GW2011_GWF2_35_18 TaxID=1618350 RepID=A0A0G0BJK4_UNCC3